MNIKKDINITFLVLLFSILLNSVLAQKPSIYLERNNWEPETGLNHDLSFNNDASLIALYTNKLTGYRLSNFKNYIINVKEGKILPVTRENSMLRYYANTCYETHASNWTDRSTYKTYKLDKATFERIEEVKEFPFMTEGEYALFFRTENRSYSLVLKKEIDGMYQEVYSSKAWNGMLTGGKVCLINEAGKSRITVYDIKSNSTTEFTLREAPRGSPQHIQITNDKKLYYHSATGKLRVFDLATKQDEIIIDGGLRNEGGLSSFELSENKQHVVYIENGKYLKVIDLTNNSLSYKLEIFKGKKQIKGFVKLNKKDVIVVPMSNDILRVFSLSQKSFTADVYFNRESSDWAVIAKDGRADGTTNAFKELEWWQYTESRVDKKTTIDKTLELNLTPRLLGLVFNDKINIPNNAQVEQNLAEQLNYKPIVKVLTPKNGSKLKENTVTIEVSAKENGDPLNGVFVYVNNKLVINSVRGFKKVTNVSSNQFNVPLVKGENIIKAVAKSEKGYESDPHTIKVFYNAAPLAKPKMQLLAVGINNYKNPKYNLNYAQNDAQAFVKAIREKGQTIFEQIEVIELYNENATRTNILQAIEKVKSIANPQDVLIVYFAGHGAMSIEQDTRDSEYFIMPSNVTQMYSTTNELVTKAISSKELMELLKNIQAQKQLLLLDACQSGGAVETFAMRGAAEEKAIAQLARSTGTYVIAASGTEQFATEVSELGHGIFTYSILQSLNGDCKSVNEQITVGILKSCVEQLVPELSAKHKGQMQFPTGFGFGQDFPIGIIKQ